VLIALAVEGSTFHQRARAHLRVDGVMKPFATCAVTQSAFLRLMVGVYLQPIEVAFRALEAIVSPPTHSFWSDGFSYLEVPRSGMQARQLTDAWLAELAWRHQSRLLTFDKGLAAAHPDVVELVR
jgi:hypothetical protein